MSPAPPWKCSNTSACRWIFLKTKPAAASPPSTPAIGRPRAKSPAIAVIVPSGSCAAMNRHGNLLQFEENPEPAIDSLASRTWEVIDFIVNGLGIKTWPGKFETPTRLAFHRSCHSRGTGTGDAVLTLLSSIENAEIIPFGQAEQCCGFGGTFCVTFPHISGRMGTLKLDHILDIHPDLLVGIDMSCLMHLNGLAQSQGRQIPQLHAIQVLRNTLKTP